MSKSKEPIFPDELIEELMKKYPNNYELGHIMRNHYKYKTGKLKIDTKKIVR
tara:strand:+ start:388 stop:543 length:156 start_codon:yes stop_codon:yes gene_type:complete